MGWDGSAVSVRVSACPELADFLVWDLDRRATLTFGHLTLWSLTCHNRGLSKLQNVKVKILKINLKEKKSV